MWYSRQLKLDSKVKYLRNLCLRFRETTENLECLKNFPTEVVFNTCHSVSNCVELIFSIFELLRKVFVYFSLVNCIFIY